MWCEAFQIKRNPTTKTLHKSQPQLYQTTVFRWPRHYSIQWTYHLKMCYSADGSGESLESSDFTYAPQSLYWFVNNSNEFIHSRHSYWVRWLTYYYMQNGQLENKLRIFCFHSVSPACIRPNLACIDARPIIIGPNLNYLFVTNNNRFLKKYWHTCVL